MPNFKIIQNLEGSKNKYTIKCGKPKCAFEFDINHLYFCHYECLSCKNKNINPNHIGFHTRRKCFYESKAAIDKELAERKIDAEIKNLKDPKILEPIES